MQTIGGLKIIEGNMTTEEMDKVNQFLVIDLGTEAIRVMIARLENDGSLKILGCADTLSNSGSSSA